MNRDLSTLFWMIGRFAIDIADKLRQAVVSQLLPDRHVLADVIPVMVNHALEEITVDASRLLAVMEDMLFEFRRRQGIQPWICGSCDRFPRLQYLF
jgi:hypothetical protein